MADIYFNADTREIRGAISILQKIPRKWGPEITRVQKKALQEVRKIIAAKLPEVYEIKRSAVRKAVSLRTQRQAGMILIRGKRLNITEYRIFPRKVKNPQHGLNVSVKRDTGMIHLRRGFLMRGANSGKLLGMKRVGPGKKDIEPIISLAIPQMMKNPEIQEEVMRRAEEVFVSELRIFATKKVRQK